MYRIICLVITLYGSLAEDVTVYKAYDYFYADPQKPAEAVAVSQFPWKFAYFWADKFYMKIFTINKSPSVTAISVTCTIDNTVFKMKKYTLYGQEYYYTSVDTLFTAEIQIQLNLYSSKIVCSSFVVAKGKRVTKIMNEPLEKEFPYYNCGGYGCSVVVDLVNKCAGPPLVIRTTMKPFTDVVNSNNKTLFYNVLNTSHYENIDTRTIKNTANATNNVEHHQSSHNIMLIYLIPSVTGTCIIILVIYLICGKKYCYRNSRPTIELDTYSTANEVVYADLGFERGDSQPPRREEESTYAQIIGVLKPADGNTKNK